MEDRFGRRLNYLRISVTDRCNLRCVYCMPEEGVKVIVHDQILTYEEIYRVARVADSLGFTKYRITGGEPLVRKDLPVLVDYLTRLPNMRDLALTTNATRLASMAEALKEAGLQRINISIDTLRRDRIRELARRDCYDQVMDGIAAAMRHGFKPLKLNVVLIRGVNDDEAMDFVDRFLGEDLTIRFIESMPLDKVITSDRAVLNEEILTDLSRRFTLEPVDGQDSAPSRTWRLAGHPLKVGFISPLSHSFCGACNRIRLTADGKLKPCLYSSTEIDLKNALRSGLADKEFLAYFAEAVNLRIDGAELLADEGFVPGRFMSQIGG